MPRARLKCQICGEPINRGTTAGTPGYDEGYDHATGLERAWHLDCRTGPKVFPFTAAVQKAKQAIADARRLTDEEYSAFQEIVGTALERQRVD